MKKKKEHTMGLIFHLRSSSLGLLQGKPFYPDKKKKKQLLKQNYLKIQELRGQIEDFHVYQDTKMKELKIFESKTK